MLKPASLCSLQELWRGPSHTQKESGPPPSPLSLLYWGPTWIWGTHHHRTSALFSPPSGNADLVSICACWLLIFLYFPFLRSYELSNANDVTFQSDKNPFQGNLICSLFPVCIFFLLGEYFSCVSRSGWVFYFHKWQNGPPFNAGLAVASAYVWKRTEWLEDVN